MDKCPMNTKIAYVLSSVAWFHHSKNLKSALLPDSRDLRVSFRSPKFIRCCGHQFFTKGVLAAITHKLWICHFHSYRRMGYIKPRPAEVWLVTRPAGGPKAPRKISQTTGPISKFQTPFDSPVRELPVQGQKFDPESTDDVTGQVKVRIFDFSGLVKSASKISMLSANKGNESAWIVSLTSGSIISCALWP